MPTPETRIGAAHAALAPYLAANPKATLRGQLAALFTDLAYLASREELALAFDLGTAKARFEQHGDFLDTAKRLGLYRPDPVPFAGVVGRDGKATITLS